MTLSPADLIRAPYTPDLTTGGIAYALNALTHPRFSAAPYEKLRRRVASAAAELAFRRYLSQQNIPFETQAATPFTDAERYDVTLNGQRCEVKSYFISYRPQALSLRHSPEVLLKEYALIPSDEHAREGHKPNDLYLFAFVAGLVAASQTDLKKVLDKGLPHYLAYVLPEAWRKPLYWNPLGRLTLKSESDEEMLVEIHGQAGAREMKRVTISLPPGVKVNLAEEFYSITALRVNQLPKARVGLHCEAIQENCVIAPLDWSNLWVYGLEIFFTGYLSHAEFSQKAQPLAANSRTFQYERTKVKNLAVPLNELKPLHALLKKE
ncbi:MAG: hypothetical protein IT310_08740 [Anaerolineales bacterium]|nr:hypothetical protein [Anaerolineales bacterium]